MLGDVEIDRWSRQILLPEVGGRGQERLLAARVSVRGAGREAEVARDLLRRAGLTVTADVADADVVVDTTSGPAGKAPTVQVERAGAAGRVRLLVGRPCAACVETTPVAAVDAPSLLGDTAAQALGALAASEVVRVLLDRPAAGREQHVDLATGRFAGAALPVTAGCTACGEDVQ